MKKVTKSELVEYCKKNKITKFQMDAAIIRSRLGGKGEDYRNALDTVKSLNPKYIKEIRILNGAEDREPKKILELGFTSRFG